MEIELIIETHKSNNFQVCFKNYLPAPEYNPKKLLSLALFLQTELEALLQTLS